MTLVLDQPVVETVARWDATPDPRRLLHQEDPEVYQAIEAERRRQNAGIEMIASENYVSPSVLAAMGSVLTNKYAEGYPGKRYYGGCMNVNVVEEQRLSAPRVCSMPIMPMSSRTPAPRLTPRPISPPLILATRCWH